MNLDEIEREGIGAGQVYLERAADLVRDLAHMLDMAGSCSDRCAVPAAMGPIGKIAWAIASTYQDNKTAVAKPLPRLRVVK